MKKHSLGTIIGLWMAFSVGGYAQLSLDEKHSTIIDIGEVLEERYVIPELAIRMKEDLLYKLQNGVYDSVRDPHQFAFQLTQDLRTISKDLHLNVSYSEKRISADSVRTDLELQEQLQWMDTILKENNYGVTKVEILEGNIGYIELPLFGPLEKCADTLIAAMRKIEDTKALILDLRKCRGSLDENTIPFLSSYFFKEPVHLFDFEIRPTDTTKQFWTYAWLPYKKYAENPIFILTSGRTFSGGEELAYDLQQIKRAVVLGETTKGGANPNEQVVVNSHYRMAVPYMRSVNPISKTNWEGTGVTPDTSVKSNIALHIAHLTALDTLLKTTSNPAEKNLLKDHIQKVEANRPTFRKVQFVLKGFEHAKKVAVSGTFNYWENDLFMHKKGTEWVGEVEVESGITSYKFIVDDTWITDPANPKTATENGNINSVLVVK